ncbi:hypothetical protein HYS48_03035 [Candidatus Woesearchaeota archaeon]|nr:hypothetical protein [Candidatus Woesearchaeota archaeon]
MSHTKNKVEWCLRKAKKELGEGKQHRGLVKSVPDIEKARAHIAKAEHNLRATNYLKQGGFTDWCSSTLFYTIYHCFLSLLAKYGYESRNQECTFAVIESLIEDTAIHLTKNELEKIRGLNIAGSRESLKTVVSIREEYQYSTKLSLEDETFVELLQLAKQILEKTKVLIED